MLRKPSSCRGCSLERLGLGFAPPVGPPNSKIAFVAEALGADEARIGEALVGQAGAMFNRILYRNNWLRKDYRLHNTVNCRPPGNFLLGAPWQHTAIEHCRVAHLDATLNEGHRVIVAMGKVAILSLLDLWGTTKVRVEDFHGRVIRDPTDRFWVIPTFHPSFLLRGKANLFDFVAHAIRTAHEVAEHGYDPGPEPSLVVDPSIGWFTRWVDSYFRALARGENVWLSVDIETPDKERQTDEGELGGKDRSWRIDRVNLSYHPDEGVTTVFTKLFKRQLQRVLAGLTEKEKALARKAVKLLFFDRYDGPRLKYNECPIEGPIYDVMWMWHVLQSDAPRGLGFVSSHYSKYKPWKHLSHTDPGEYAAADAFQTTRTGYGCAQDLVETGMWGIFYRHIYLLDTYALRPAEEIGLNISIPRLEEFGAELRVKRAAKFMEIQACVPEQVLPLKASTKEGWKKKPEVFLVDGVEHVKTVAKEGEEVLRPLVTIWKNEMVQVCKTCEAEQVVKKHRCKEKGAVPRVVLEEREVPRYFRRDPFNPLSVDQKLAYIRWRGHKPGRSKKDKSKVTTDKATMERLATTTRDPFYLHCMDISKISKVQGTYVEGSLRRLREDPRSIEDHRLHPTITHKPSTLRTSCVNPNLQNVVADREGPGAIAAGFRRCVVASEGCYLVEPDFSAIEAVMVGWFCGDPNYIRLAKLGIHAYVACHLPEVNQKVSTSWSDSDLAALFSEIKKKFPEPYDQSKRTVHSVSYGQTPPGTLATYPKVFKDLRTVEKVRGVFFEVAPKIRPWQTAVQNAAHEQGYLGGPGDLTRDHNGFSMGAHPFGYRHWYWDVFRYRPITYKLYLKRREAGLPSIEMYGRYYSIDYGEDAKRAVSFFPQSTAGGVSYEAMLKLYMPPDVYEEEEGGDNSHLYIGDLYHGQTPLRTPIHDSLLNDIPGPKVEESIERMYAAMTAPVLQLPCPKEWGLGEYITVGVEVKVGKNWGAYNDDPSAGPLNLDGMKKVKVTHDGVASDMLPTEITDAENEGDTEDEYEGQSGGYYEGPAGAREEKESYQSDDDVPF